MSSYLGLVVVICEALYDSGLFCLLMLLAVIEADHFSFLSCVLSISLLKEILAEVINHLLANIINMNIISD